VRYTGSSNRREAEAQNCRDPTEIPTVGNRKRPVKENHILESGIDKAKCLKIF
jgi:hypothetical protein